jgi:iron complex transport system permease protein
MRPIRAARVKPLRLHLALGVLAAVLFALSLLIGPAGLGPAESFAGLAAGGDEAATIIMREIRLPRALLAMLIGFSLGISGAALQGFLRNPLAEPGLIGVSATAALGAVLVFYSGLAGASLLALPAGALAGALLAVLALLAIAARHGSTLTLILAGVALSSLSAALTALVLNLSPNPFASFEIIFWLLGSIKDRSLAHVWLAAPLMVAGWALILLAGRALDALSLGEEAAQSLGVRMARTRLLIVTGVALCVGAGTAVAGAIGFIGLVVPHLVRPLTDRMPSRLLLPAGLGGGALLLAADVAVRVIIPERELNVGVLTALIGAPFFLWLVIRSRRDVF